MIRIRNGAKRKGHSGTGRGLGAQTETVVGYGFSSLRAIARNDPDLMKVEPPLKRPSRDRPFTTFSYKCKIKRCTDCSALHCTCTCHDIAE